MTNNNGKNPDFLKTKGLLFDVDKTLTTTQHIISHKTISSLKKLQNTNLKFGLCTGRSYAMLKNYVLNFFPGYSVHVTSGGGEVISKEGKIIWSKYIDLKLVKTIINETEKLKSEYCFSQGDIFFGSKRIVNEYLNHPWNIKTSFQINQVNLRHIPLISIINLNTQCRNFFKELQGVVVKEMLGTNKQPYLDITQEGVTKLTGSIVWARINNLKIEEIAAFGDSENDLEVLNSVGLGIAMGNATEKIKKMAKIVIKHTNEDGLSQFINKLIKEDNFTKIL